MASTARHDEKAGCAVLCQTSALLSPVLWLLRMALWPARSAKALSCTTPLPVAVGEGVWEARGEGRWTWTLPVGQSPPSINACWLNLPVLLDGFSFKLADMICYQGLSQLQISAILCLLCRVVCSSLCSKLSLTSSFWLVGMVWVTVVHSTYPLYSWVGKPRLCPSSSTCKLKAQPVCALLTGQLLHLTYY